MKAKRYETECALLVPAAIDRLRSVRLRRESQLHQQIETAIARIRSLHADLELITGSRRQSAEEALRKQEDAMWTQTVRSAAALAAEGVKEFANGMLGSQGRLGDHADMLRRYAASLVNDIRDSLQLVRAPGSRPLLPWAQDPVTQSAIQACEAVIADRSKAGDRWPHGNAALESGKPGWPPVVLEWEAFKAIHEIESGNRERIPESVLRSLLANQHQIEPRDVGWDQIRQAAEEFVSHYGPVLMIPQELEIPPAAKAAPAARKAAGFWEERGNEFHKYDTPDNTRLSAVWSSIDGRWEFRSASIKESSPLESEQVFKALAREAARGLTGSRDMEPWDWLDALRCACDPVTGQSLYSKTLSYGSQTYGEQKLESVRKSGEPVPPGGLIEFIRISEPDGDPGQAPEGISAGDAVEMRMVWETRTETIERLFTRSANFCLELRSRVRGAEESPRGPNVDVAKIGVVPPVAAEAVGAPTVRRRGPKPDRDNARRVDAIVAREAPDGDWRSRLEDICLALDEAKIPSPRLWKKKGVRDWYSAFADEECGRHVVVEAIKYRLNSAKD